MYSIYIRINYTFKRKQLSYKTGHEGIISPVSVFTQTMSQIHLHVYIMLTYIY